MFLYLCSFQTLLSNVYICHILCSLSSQNSLVEWHIDHSKCFHIFDRVGRSYIYIHPFLFFFNIRFISLNPYPVFEKYNWLFNYHHRISAKILIDFRPRSINRCTCLTPVILVQYLPCSLSLLLQSLYLNLMVSSYYLFQFSMSYTLCCEGYFCQ